MKIETYKCGCTSSNVGLLNLLWNHDFFILTKGNKRWRKTVCIPTGKWWKVEMPDLEEIK